ncbi:hypothetical protein EDD94_2764 [Streptomyces sp. PanSC9]|nr:hypothetical protein EDD94_2764 [Streptomyces sp. PanSC9]
MVTSRISARTVQAQLASQSEEAERQRRFTSAQARREPRAKAYAEFLSAAQDTWDTAVSGDGSQDRFVEELGTLRKLRATVAVVGPEPVAVSATTVFNGVSMALEVAAGSESPFAMQVHAAFGEFIEAARTALEDEGHQS